MTSDMRDTLASRYRAYVDHFREAQGAMPLLHQIKVDHTAHVVANTRAIARDALWPESMIRVGEAVAWLHDVGRHVQLRDYGTFRDADSIDHAACGVRVIREEKLLSGIPRTLRADITVAVALHSRLDVPPALRPRAARLTHLVRDADKLDIFRVLEMAISDGLLAKHPEIAWGLQIQGAPSPDVVETVCAGLPVRYTQVHNLADFVLIQIGWLISGLHYAGARRLAVERGVLPYRAQLLRRLCDDDPGAARCCVRAQERLDRDTGAA